MIDSDISSKFLRNLEDGLDLKPGTLTESTMILDLDWDSLAMITTIAIFDEVFGKSLSAEKLEICKTLGDIINMSDHD